MDQERPAITKTPAAVFHCPYTTYEVALNGNGTTGRAAPQNTLKHLGKEKGIRRLTQQ